MGHKSKVPGKMHGCGHDTNVVMLLGSPRFFRSIMMSLRLGTIFFFSYKATIISYCRIESFYVGPHIWATSQEERVKRMDWLAAKLSSCFDLLQVSCFSCWDVGLVLDSRFVSLLA